MTTDPTDLREKIASALAIQQGYLRPEHHHDRWDGMADAVLPIVREAQAEAWGKGHSAGWHDHALDVPYAPLTFTPNPYKPAT